MTPEELNRTIEFLVQHQAHFAVRFERDHEIFAETLRTLAELTGIQSRRLDRHDVLMHEIRAWQQNFEDEADKLHGEVLDRLDRIIEKLRQRSN